MNPDFGFLALQLTAFEVFVAALLIVVVPVYAIVAAAYTRYQPLTFALAFFAVGPSFIGFVFSSVVIRLEAAICSSYLLWALSYLLVVMVALLAKRSVGFALPRDPLVLFLQL